MRVSPLHLLWIAAAASLASCGTLQKVTYDRPARVESSFSAEVTLVSGVVTGEQFALVLTPLPVPILTSPPKGATFNIDDQKSFVSSLVDELNQLKILRARATEAPLGDKPDISIQVAFLRTYARDTPVDTYTLEVELSMCDRERCVSERYDVNSSDGDASTSHLSLTIAGAKARVAKKLLAEVIPDIETFLSRK